jgi:hypothetical protein
MSPRTQAKKSQKKEKRKQEEMDEEKHEGLPARRTCGTLKYNEGQGEGGIKSMRKELLRWRAVYCESSLHTYHGNGRCVQ